MSTDMVRFVEVEGWSVAVEGVGDPTEGRVLDIEVGEKLGYSRGGKRFRQFIAALVKQGILLGVYVRTVTVQTSMPNGGVRTQTVTEYWLTKEQILVAAAKSTTPVAQQILDQMVKVFVLVQERGLVALTAPGKIQPLADIYQQEAALMTQQNLLLDKAFAQLEDLEAKGEMDSTTASAHRTYLLKVHGGIDLTKAPLVKYESVAVQMETATVVMPVDLSSIPTPGNRPIKELVVKPRVSKGKDEYYANELGDLFGVTALIIGQLARGAGIFGKITLVENEYGYFYDQEKGMEGKTVENWIYSNKSKDILHTLASNYLATLPNKPKKLGTKVFAVQVGKAWKAQQPTVPATVVSAPN